MSTAQAFLYGDGDFKKTMGIAIAAGFDCDNQACLNGDVAGMSIYMVVSQNMGTPI